MRAKLIAAFHALAILACSVTPSNHDAQVVEFTLPDGGLRSGTPSELALVEFGSHTCAYCLIFHKKLLPVINAEFGDGRLHYRYVNVDTGGLNRKLYVVTTCGAEQIGLRRAQDWAFKTVRDSAAILEPEAALQRENMDIRPDQLMSCVPRASEVERKELASADDLGVQMLPTYVIGHRSGTGAYRGWVVSGNDSAAIMSYLRRASQLKIRGNTVHN